MGNQRVTSSNSGSGTHASYKVVFVGNCGSGKTKTARQLLGDSHLHQHSHVCTLGVEVHPVIVGNKTFNIWDCAGKPQYLGLSDGYYIMGQIFFIFQGGQNFRTPQEWAIDILASSPNATIIVVPADAPPQTVLNAMVDASSYL